MITIRYSKKGLILALTIILSALIAWAVRHVANFVGDYRISEPSLALIWAISFVSLAWINTVAFFEKPKTLEPKNQTEIDKLNVAVLVPVYNEDQGYLKACLESLLNQTRRPDQIHIVDDGSTASNYSLVIRWVKQELAPHIKTTWVRTDNRGKRHAQVKGMDMSPDADIYVTIDSDTILEHRAIEEGLKPFIDPKIQSVAGIRLPMNGDQNILTRFFSTWETVWQLVDRSHQSVLNCVTVNCGPLALYRAETIRQYTSGYLNETFMGKPVSYSDDSLLTTYALYHGKTIQQPTSVCFTAVPDNLNHHIRQYTRWMRGSFIRSFWRFKYLQVMSYVWWLHWFKWFQLLLSSFVFFYIVYKGGFTNPNILPYIIGIPIAVSYVQSLRYLTLVRSDQSSRSRFINFLLAPLSMLWLITVLRLVKYYAYLTAGNMKWGTREKVETRLAQ